MKHLILLTILTACFLTLVGRAGAKIIEPATLPKNEAGKETKSIKETYLPAPIIIPVPPAKSVPAKSKPTLAKVRNARIRLGYGKKSQVVDLATTDGVTLGGESPHRYKLFFTAVKEGKIFFLFQVQSGPAISDPNAPCGGDAPQTLVWLQTASDLQITVAKSEVFASCAYNGGRYQQGKAQLTANKLRIIFEQQKDKTEISYDNQTPENGFTVKKL